jgi:hypothetical protein
MLIDEDIEKRMRATASVTASAECPRIPWIVSHDVV